MSENVKKLLIKEGYKVRFINEPDGYIRSLGKLPENTEIVEQDSKNVDFVQLFVNDSKELDKFLSSVLKSIKYDGLLWICYPKGSSKVPTDLNRDILWRIMQDYDYDAVALVSINEIWSSMRLRPMDRNK
jgi:hypothetical protein